VVLPGGVSVAVSAPVSAVVTSESRRCGGEHEDTGHGGSRQAEWATMHDDPSVELDGTLLASAERGRRTHRRTGDQRQFEVRSYCPRMEVVAAAIVDGDPPRLLAAPRAYPHALAGRWELPGGKVEAGESDVEALTRELREELGVEVVVRGRAAPDVATVGSGGVLRTYWVDVVAGEPRAIDHAALRWLHVDELNDVEWLAPDLPVIAAVEARMRAS
jgi:8-oxo-dGTP diphosphatase